MERHNVSRLSGRPPAYVGFDEGGQLTEAVRRKNYCVVLLDEVERPIRSLKHLLQILGMGIVSDPRVAGVDFRNCIIIMTRTPRKQLQTNSSIRSASGIARAAPRAGAYLVRPDEGRKVGQRAQAELPAGVLTGSTRRWFPIADGREIP